jgi:hypothetical protein
LRASALERAHCVNTGRGNGGSRGLVEINGAGNGPSSRDGDANL